MAVHSLTSSSILHDPAVTIPALGNGSAVIALTSVSNSSIAIAARAIHEFSDRKHNQLVTFFMGSDGLYITCGVGHDPFEVHLAPQWHLAEPGLLEWLESSTILIKDVHQFYKNDLNNLHNVVTGIRGCQVIAGHKVVRRKSARLPDVFDGVSETVIPSLKGNKDYLGFFVSYFLAHANILLGRDVLAFSASALEIVLNYPWPAELTELKETIFRSVMFGTDGEELSVKTLPQHIITYEASYRDVRKAVLLAEKGVIQRALQECNNNKRKAADLLRISRKTLYSKMRLFTMMAEGVGS